MPIPALIGAALIGGGASLLGSIGSWLFGKSSNNSMLNKQMAWNTKEREASQEFTDQQRQASQGFQTNEREAQNAFSEQMYNKYLSPEAMVRQYKEAGLNPALAVEGAGSLGSMSASSGSTGGAPSGSGSSPLGLSMPYNPVADPTAGFQNIGQAIKTIFEADKVGVESSNLRAMADDMIRQAHNVVRLQELEMDTTKINNRHTLKLIEKLDAEISKDNANTAVLKQTLDNLVQEGVITKYKADTFMENFRNDQLHKIAETELSKAETKRAEADAKLKGSQEENVRADTVNKWDEHKLFDLKQQLMRSQIADTDAGRALKSSLTELNNLQYEIRNATSAQERAAAEKEFQASKLEALQRVNEAMELLSDAPGAKSFRAELRALRRAMKGI